MSTLAAMTQAAHDLTESVWLDGIIVGCLLVTLICLLADHFSRSDNTRNPYMREWRRANRRPGEIKGDR